MLCLTRFSRQCIMIDLNDYLLEAEKAGKSLTDVANEIGVIEVKMININSYEGKATIGFDAHPSIRIHRREIFERIKAEKAANEQFSKSEKKAL